MAKTVKTKKRFNVARTLVVLLFLYVIVSIVYYIYKEPLRHIEISGNNYLSDNTIINSLGIKDYPSFISINPKKLENILDSNDFIKSSNVHFGLNFTLYINIEENKPLIKQKSSNGIILSDGTIVEDDNTFIGLPVLLNDPTKDVIKELASSLSKVDSGILYTISEIQYTPSYNSKNQVIDQNRFLLTMIDGNNIYITASKANLLNKYLDIAASTYKKGKGTLYLDSGIDSYLFTPNTTTTTTTKKVTTTTKKTTKKETKTKNTTSTTTTTTTKEESKENNNDNKEQN